MGRLTRYTEEPASLQPESENIFSIVLSAILVFVSAPHRLLMEVSRKIVFIDNALEKTVTLAMLLTAGMVVLDALVYIFFDKVYLVEGTFPLIAKVIALLGLWGSSYVIKSFMLSDYNLAELEDEENVAKEEYLVDAEDDEEDIEDEEVSSEIIEDVNEPEIFEEVAEPSLGGRDNDWQEPDSDSNFPWEEPVVDDLVGIPSSWEEKVESGLAPMNSGLSITDLGMSPLPLDTDLVNDAGTLPASLGELGKNFGLDSIMGNNVQFTGSWENGIFGAGVDAPTFDDDDVERSLLLNTFGTSAASSLSVDVGPAAIRRLNNMHR